MSRADSMHVVTVGMTPILVRDLWDRIQLKVDYPISHIAHPTFNHDSWAAVMPVGAVTFFRDDMRTKMPSPNRELLASLEIAGVPTIHNMILSDRFVSKLLYEDALAYATFLTQRLMAIYRSLKPTVVIGGFDSLHGSLGFAVAKFMRIPWFVLNFNSLPSGQVAFCSDLSPASKVMLEPQRAETMRSTADRLLQDFEGRKIEAAAYIPPKLFSASFIIKRIPVQLRALIRIARRRTWRDTLKYTDHPSGYSISGLFREAIRLRKNVLRLPHDKLLHVPLNGRYAFFGLHVQPESSIDVFAHFFSNQVQVVELMARSLPPTHTLLVKLHKSDVPNYSRALMAALARLPGVCLVSPYADTFEFIKRADLILSIQGTIGLEGALLGKPVIMFGDSPTRRFPSVSTLGRNPDLPALVRQKIAEAAPGRAAIVDAFAAYLASFYPASRNDWTIRPTDDEIEGYVHLFELLENYLRSNECSLLLANQ
jgi:hypothetical protein